MGSQTFGEKAIAFYNSLTPPSNLPENVTAFSPLKHEEANKYANKFYSLFFNDNKKRIFVLGINPGRFGSGVTGINFTDPVALQEDCGIKNTLLKRRELSSEFVYTFIHKWGGAKKFYQDFFLTALSPVGFLYNGLNYNYYDNKALLLRVQPFIVQTLKKQRSIGAHGVAILFGTGKNQKFFSKLNNTHHFFKKVYALEHPRYIMQYKRKYLDEYLRKYRNIFSQSLLEKTC